MYPKSSNLSDNQQKTWRIGVIDYYRNNAKGGHGIHEAFMGLPNVEICAAADPDQQSLLDLQKDTGAKNAYSDWQELLEKESPDVVCLCSRLPVQHPDVVIGSAQAGCHIYCEKPFASTLTEADEMIAAVDKSGVKVTVAHLARYSEPITAAKKLIQSGELGRPLIAYCRGKEDERGGGEDMMVLGTHLFDISRFLFGDPQWVFGHVSKDGRDMIKTDSHEPTEPVGPVAGDEIFASFGFPGNIHCHFESRHDMYDGENWRFGITIICTKAKLSFRYGEGERVLKICRTSTPFEDGGKFEVVPDTSLPDIPGAVPLSGEKSGSGIWAYYAKGNRRGAWDLLNAISEDRKPISSGHDALWTLEMLQGVYASHLSGKRIALPLTQRTHPLE